MQYQTYISHHGIDGQKWGVRNGPPYPLDKSRKEQRKKKRYREFSNNYLTQNIKSGKDKPNKSPAESIIGETGKTIRSLESALRTIGDVSKRQKASNRTTTLSDSELQAVIKRLDMERQYRNLTADDTRSGFNYISTFLDVAGDLASIALSGATIASILYGIKKLGLSDTN